LERHDGLDGAIRVGTLSISNANAQ
jgi:hypothetical protein